MRGKQLSREGVRVQRTNLTLLLVVPSGSDLVVRDCSCPISFTRISVHAVQSFQSFKDVVLQAVRMCACFALLMAVFSRGLQLCSCLGQAGKVRNYVST